MTMDDRVEIREKYKCGRGRRCGIVNGQLKWGDDQGHKFEFVRGQKYKVSYLNPAITQHKGAVGVYVGSRRGRGGCKVMLDCMGNDFRVDALELVPWEGEITQEHLKLISPIKGRVHLMSDNQQPACGCSRSPDVGGGTLGMEEFLMIPENSRCTNCNSKARTLKKK